MNEAVQKKWAEALMSDKFVQGKDYLRQQIGSTVFHCCLGVLCELYKEETSGLEWDNSNGDRVFKAVIPAGDPQSELMIESLFPPVRVQAWAGITEETCKNLSRANDCGKFNFNAIAEMISTGAIPEIGEEGTLL